MAVDINNTHLPWELPATIRNFDQNKALIDWAPRHTLIQGNWLVLRPFSCSRAELTALSDAVTDMGPLKYDFQSALKLYWHLSNFQRF